jgi:hypothetical protein
VTARGPGPPLDCSAPASPQHAGSTGGRNGNGRATIAASFREGRTCELGTLSARDGACTRECRKRKQTTTSPLRDPGGTAAAPRHPGPALSAAAEGLRPPQPAPPAKGDHMGKCRELEVHTVRWGRGGGGGGGRWWPARPVQSVESWRAVTPGARPGLSVTHLLPGASHGGSAQGSLRLKVGRKGSLAGQRRVPLPFHPLAHDALSSESGTRGQPQQGPKG